MNGRVFGTFHDAHPGRVDPAGDHHSLVGVVPFAIGDVGARQIDDRIIVPRIAVTERLPGEVLVSSGAVI